jgi:hypothetical protein
VAVDNLEGNQMNERTDWTSWDWLKAATDAGWCDPGETEPLDVTVNRAKEFLEAEWTAKSS